MSAAVIGRAPTEVVADFAALLADADDAGRAALLSRAKMAGMASASTDALDTAGRIKAENLADLDDESLPATLGDFIVEGQVNWLSGHPGKGKTTLAMHAALVAIGDGRDVLWLDWEGGRLPTKRRLRALGATDDALRRLHYVGFERLSADADALAALRNVLDRLDPGPLVVFDSASKALSTAGLDENSNTDATRWTTEVVMPLRELATVIVIDHSVKGATRSTPYPGRGAGSKLADCEVSWFVECNRPFSRLQVGEVTLWKHKDREGILPERVRFEVGDGAGKLPIIRLADEASDAGVPGDSKVRAAVLDTLRKHDGAELSGRQLLDLTPGKAQAVRDAAKTLAADPAMPVSARAGSRNSVLYAFDAAAVTAIEP